MNSKKFIKLICGKWKILRTINQYAPHNYSQSQLNRIRQLSMEQKNEIKLPQFSLINRLQFVGIAECVNKDQQNDSSKQQKNVSEYFYEQRLTLKSNNNKKIQHENQSMTTQRKYVYQINNQQQNKAWKLFQNRNVFEQINFNKYENIGYENKKYLAFDTKHCCLKDIYFGQYLIPLMSQFSLQQTSQKQYLLKYRVIGPTKNYQIFSVYERKY